MDILLDNSALSTLHCERKFQLTVLRGLSSTSTATDFGSAYHKSLELLHKGIEPMQVVNEVFASAPNVDKLKLLSILILFKQSFKMPEPIMIGDPPVQALEYKFKYLYETIDNINFHLCGTVDRLHMDKDILVFLDYKTSAAGSEYLIEKTIKEYSLAFQLPFYVYALYNSGMLSAAQMELINMGKYRCEIWFAFYNSPNAPFKKVIRPAFHPNFIGNIVPNIISARIEQILKIIERDRLKLSASYTGMNTYTACTNCTFRPACLVAGTDREDYVLTNHFNTKPYDPMSFR